MVALNLMLQQKSGLVHGQLSKVINIIWVPLIKREMAVRFQQQQKRSSMTAAMGRHL